VTRPPLQVAFLDTPGVHQAKGPLNRFMVDVALRAAEDCDVVLFLIEAEGKREDTLPTLGENNRFILEKLKALKKPTFLVINKIDQVNKALLLPLIDLFQREFPFAQVLPISARTGDNVEQLFALVAAAMPEAEAMFPADVFTDQAERALVSELIREQLLHHTRQEVPYASAVRIDGFDETERDSPPPKKVPAGKSAKAKGATRAGLKGLVRIFASILVERDSQKAIVIGKKGQMLKAIGTDARKQIERMLGANVYLSLQVKVEPRWSERPATLKELGYTLG
jgi:GTP-binding protein Era